MICHVKEYTSQPCDSRLPSKSFFNLQTSVLLPEIGDKNDTTGVTFMRGRMFLSLHILTPESLFIYPLVQQHLSLINNLIQIVSLPQLESSLSKSKG